MTIRIIDARSLMSHDQDLYEVWHRRLVNSWDDMPGTQPRNEALWRAHLTERYGLEMVINDGGLKPRWNLLIHDEVGATEFVLRYS